MSYILMSIVIIIWFAVLLWSLWFGGNKIKELASSVSGRLEKIFMIIGDILLGLFVIAGIITIIAGLYNLGVVIDSWFQ